MKVKIKKLSDAAVVPSYAKIGDAGMDLTATSKCWNVAGFFQYGTSIALEIPRGYVGLIYPRSSISERNMMLCNHVGVIDSEFRGELCLRFKYINLMTTSCNTYEIGDRIGQLMIVPYPQIEFEEVEELSTTIRGNGGFGSTN